MGHGQGSACGQLLLEQGHYRTGGAQHVTKTHRHEPRRHAPDAGAQVQGLAITFRQPFTGPHDAGGIHGLVGGDLNHHFRLGFDAGVGHVARANDIGENALTGIGLHHRHVLERGGVKDQGRSLHGHNLVQPFAVAHVAYDGTAGQVGMVRGDLKINAVELEFTVIEQGDPGGPQSADLARQFAADGPTGTGNQYRLVLDQGLHGGAVENRLRASQKVLDGHRLDFQMFVHPALEVAEPGQAGQGQAEGVGLVEQSAHHRAIEVVLGDNQPLRCRAAFLEPRHHLFQVVHQAHHRHAVDLAAQPRRFIRQHTQSPVGGFRIAGEITQKQFRRVARAHQKHRNV